MGELIKTTARFQEEPIRQKPIIQIERPLPNTVRASIDSGGRDNPFKPDGRIYKSADPIVDYYKFGPNQSRAQTPTDSQLLLNGGKKGGGKNGESSCWRRWLCCCCFCCSRKSDQKDTEAKARQPNQQRQQQQSHTGQVEQPKIVVVRSSMDDFNDKEASKSSLATLEFTPSSPGSENTTEPKVSLENTTTTKKSGRCVVS